MKNMVPLTKNLPNILIHKEKNKVIFKSGINTEKTLTFSIEL